jgi:hypothetical protein
MESVKSMIPLGAWAAILGNRVEFLGYSISDKITVVGVGLLFPLINIYVVNNL